MLEKYLPKEQNVMATSGKDGIRTKIRNKPLQQISHFGFLECEVTYDKDNDYMKKLNRLQSVCWTIAKTFKIKAPLEPQVRLYNILAVPIALHGSEARSTTKVKELRLTTMEMTFLRKIKVICREGRIRNELKTQSLEKKSKSIKNKWKGT